jgi:membrane-associated protein
MGELTADWLRVLQTYFSEYGIWFVLAALFLENVMLLGTIIPGAVVLVMGGWLAQQQGQGFPYLLVLVGFIGTISGDIVSYGIGKKVGGRLLQSKRWSKGLNSVSERVRNEPALLMFCHFGSYLRMFVPASAGMSGVPFRRWLMLDATGAALWVSSHVAAGYFLSMSGALSSMKTVAVVIILLVLGIVGIHYFKAARLRRQVPNP